MKKALFKDSVKEIRNTYKRFISILLMAFLGVGFFAGIRASSPDMVDTIDQYYKNQNVYDIEVISTLGLTKEDIDELSKIEGIDKAEASYEIDGEIDIDNTEIVTRVISVVEINKPLLLEGSLPQHEDECVVEKSFLTSKQKQIGDTIEVEIENTTNDEGEEKEYLKHKEMKIVGTVQSPLYISRERGSSKLGSGKVNYYIYISKDNINVPEVYTAIYLKIKDADQYKTASKTYENKVEEIKEKIETIKEQREKARYDALVEKATDKVTEAEEKLNTEKQEAQDKINQAEKEIEDGKQKIVDSENEINANKKKADTEFANAQKKIAEAEKTIKSNEENLIQKEAEANNKFQELEQQKQNLKIQLEQVESGLEQINNQYARNFRNIKKCKPYCRRKSSIRRDKTIIRKSKTTNRNSKKTTRKWNYSN